MLNLKITGPVDVQVISDSTQFNTEGSLTILLMGTTGSGKSSFIECIVKDKAKNLRISGDQLDGATQQLTVYKIQNMHLSLYPAINIYIIDTTGFLDRKIPESKSLRMVQKWMKKSGCKYIDRILYFDRITDPRMAGSKARVLALFKAISGEKTGRSVTFVTTMWNTLWKKDQVQRANKRFEELSNVHYKEFLDDGARVVKFLNDHNSALNILHKCLSRGSDHLFGFELHMLGNESGTMSKTDTTLLSLLRTNLITRRETLQPRLSHIRIDLSEESTQTSTQLVQVLSEEVADIGADLQVVEDELKEIAAQIPENQNIYCSCSISTGPPAAPESLTTDPKLLKEVLAILRNYRKHLGLFLKRKTNRLKNIILRLVVQGRV